MASIIASVFQATMIGLLVNKGRDMTANKLKQGDATDEKFRNLIVREIDDIKSKLDGLARTNLLASISFFKEGLVYLFKVLDSVKTSEEDGKLTVQRTMGIEENSLPSASASVKTVSLAGEMKSLQLTGQDDSTTRALSDAKDRFKQAREKATEAFCNEALSTSDRILAMKYRVMATLLEKVDNPADALAACRLCLEELHAMPAVQKSFKVQLKQGFKSRFNKAEREETIRSVCRVNRVISSVTIMISGMMNLSLCPCVDLGEKKVDPLRDIRVTESLQEYDTELLLKQWSLVQEGEEEQTDIKNCCITTNMLGQFIIADVAYLRFFDSSGKHLYSNRLQFVAREMRQMGSNIKDIAFDRNNSMFLLINCRGIQKDKNIRYCSIVYLCDEHGNLQHKFELKEGSRGFLITVSDNNNVFVAVGESNAQEVQVYDTKGLYINSFGKATLTDNIFAMTAINSADCEIMVMTYGRSHDVIVHTFSADWGADNHSHRKLRWNFALISIAYHHVTDHVFLLDRDTLDVVRGIDLSKSYPNKLQILTKDGTLVRKIHLPLKSLRNLYEQPLQTTVTNEGLVVMCAVDKRTRKRMITLL